MTDRPVKFDRGPSQRPRPSLPEEILDLDARLLSLLARRLRLTQRAARGRQTLDRELEKRLRTGFEQAAREQGLDPRLSRQLYALLGGFGLEAPASRRSADKPFVLAPRSEPVDIDVSGPRSLGRTRMLAVLAAASGQRLRLAGVVLNDPLVELVKALNQAGAHLSWTDDALEAAQALPKEGEPLLRFEEALTFAGDEPSTLYALLALALREAGRSKFAGGAGLKFLDLRPLAPLLQQMGARAASMNPRSHGLPARLESSGELAAVLRLGPESPPAFAQALALAAWSYPEGLRILLADDTDAAAAQALALNEAVDVLRQCGIKAALKDGACVIPAGQPRLPAAPALPLDPALSAYLLALPAFAGGSARLAGEIVLPNPVRQDFEALGLEPETRPDAVLCRHAALSSGQTLVMGRDARLLPLALALALAAGGGTVALPADPQARAWAEELLERLGAGHKTLEGAVRIEAGEQAHWEGVWTSPDPYCTLALALLSFRRQGIALDNPGGLAALWPKFWNLYNALPVARDAAPAGKKPEPDEPKPRRNRIRV